MSNKFDTSITEQSANKRNLNAFQKSNEHSIYQCSIVMMHGLKVPIAVKTNIGVLGLQPIKDNQNSFQGRIKWSYHQCLPNFRD